MSARLARTTPPDRGRLDELLERAKARGPMTPAELREQRISFVYGQLWDGDVTREQVERAHDERYGKP